MKCPVCSAESLVKDSRPTETGGIRRRRRCPKNHRFSTEEVVIVEAERAPKPPKAKKRILDKMDLPLTYLTAAQKVRAKAFFAAGWTVKEVGELYDMSPTDMRK